MTTLQRVVFFISVAMATFMIVLDYSIANISIPYIAGDLAVNNSEGTYVITSFAVGNAIGLLLTGWVAKRVGQIRLLIFSIASFTFFSWMCGLSWNLVMLVLSRFIQGLVSGPMVPLSQSLLIRYGTPKSHLRDLAIWSTIVITAPVVGPILGGYISDYYKWSWIFYINIPVGIICTVSFWVLLRKDETAIEKVPSDVWGIIWLTIGVACLQIFLDKGQEWDWWNSLRIRALIIGSIIGFVLFYMRERWYSYPLMALRLFKIPSFTVSILSLLISYAIYFGTVVVVPLWLQEYMGYTPEKAGLAVSALGVCPVLFSLLTPFVIKKIGNIATLLISFVIFTCACFYAAYFTTEADLQHIAFARLFFGLGVVCYFNSILGLSVADIPTQELPNATSIFHFVRAMVGGIGTSVFITLWLRRTIFHHERVGAMMTSYNEFATSSTDTQALSLLNGALDKQAAMLAINDTFFLMAWLFAGLVGVLMILLIVRRKKPKEHTPGVPEASH